MDAGDTSITQYTWDARDRMTEVRNYATYGDVVANTPTQVVDYLYDVENRWIGENIFTSSGEHETRFAYDGNQIVLEFDKDVVDNNATVGAADLSHRYVWQPNAVDQLMADEQVTTAGKVVWTLGDNQGTIRDLAVTDPSTGVTSVATHRVFDSYGNLVSSTNAAVACLFGYTGKAFDNATGLQNNLNRWYDAKVGRWLSEDPSGFDGGQTNIDVYCGNSPTNAVDPSGLAKTRTTTEYAWIQRNLTISDPVLNAYVNSYIKQIREIVKKRYPKTVTDGTTPGNTPWFTSKKPSAQLPFP